MASAGATLAQDIRPQDTARLDRFSKSAGDAILEAMAHGDPTDVSALTTALSGEPQVAFDASLAGEWTCRTMKLGGTKRLVIYSAFKCRITLDATGADFEKLTGSQRTNGRISLREGQAIYVGVGHTSDQSPPAYVDLPEDFQSNGSIQTDVAVFERVSPIRARLMFPAPAVESDFDILELTR